MGSQLKEYFTLPFFSLLPFLILAYSTNLPSGLALVLVVCSEFVCHPGQDRCKTTPTNAPLNGYCIPVGDGTRKL